MNDALIQKMAKILELCKWGATPGEKQAAKEALNRILSKYKIDESQLTNVLFNNYRFTFSSRLEKTLLACIIDIMISRGVACCVQTGVKRIMASLTYSEWVTVECAYEYFRRHMKAEYKKHVAPQLAKCRKAKTRRELKQKLEQIFISNYIIASGLVKQESIQQIDPKQLSTEEYKLRCKLADVQGGQYKQQVDNTKLLTN